MIRLAFSEQQVDRLIRILNDINHDDVEDLLSAAVSARRSASGVAVCGYCGGLFQQNISGRKPQYCSSRCKQAAYRRNQTERRLQKIVKDESLMSDELQDFYQAIPNVVAEMPKDRFHSHEFIARLTQHHQISYVRALQESVEKGSSTPFQVIHKAVAKKLKQSGLVREAGKTLSHDIFGGSQQVPVWERLPVIE